MTLSAFGAGHAVAATTYTYDQLGRLVRADYAAGNYIVYRYDAAGNRTEVVGNASTNVAPTAVDDSIVLRQDTPFTFDPRSNDMDPDYDQLTILAKTDGAHGSVAIDSGTSLTYTPAAGYRGTDSFSYTIGDGAGHTATAIVGVTVVDSAP